MIPERLHTIFISWSYPIAFDRKDFSKYIGEKCGIYYISRRYKNCAKRERDTYIGETKRSFAKRLKEHEKDYAKGKDNFINTYGKKFVRFGVIENLPNLDDAEMKSFLRTVESTILWTLPDAESDLINVRQMGSATFTYKLKIINNGFRGSIPKEIDNWDFFE